MIKISRIEIRHATVGIVFTGATPWVEEIMYGEDNITIGNDYDADNINCLVKRCNLVHSATNIILEARAGRDATIVVMKRALMDEYPLIVELLKRINRSVIAIQNGECNY